MLTLLQACHSQGHGRLRVLYVVGLIQDDEVPEDLEQGGTASHTV